MINQHSFQEIMDLTKHIDSKEYPVGSLIVIKPKPYMELIKLFGTDNEGFIDTPWTTVITMEVLFKNGNTIQVSVPNYKSRNTLRTDWKNQRHYLVNYGGWSYPSGAFNLINAGALIRGKKHKIPIIKELHV